MRDYSYSMRFWIINGKKTKVISRKRKKAVTATQIELYSTGMDALRALVFATQNVEFGLTLVL